MNSSLNILFSASEVAPFAKTGGLADVAGALPKSLHAMGHNVIVVMPRYYQIDTKELKPVSATLKVPMGGMGELFASVYQSNIPGSDVVIYFIDYEEFFGRKGLYDDNSIAYDDNDIRFLFFSKAVFELCLKLGFKPDVIHANDWHTAAMPILAQTRYKHDFGDAATVVTIHNLQHQRVFSSRGVDFLEIGWEHFKPESFESMGALNILKGGIAYADAVTTVSKKYAKEIQTSEFGFGLEHHISQHAYKLFGILNGVDYEEWNPSVDKHIVKKYDSEAMAGKEKCKTSLQEHFGLEIDSGKALIGFVGRFAHQKGIEMIAGVLEGLLALDIAIVVLGTGEKWAESYFSEMAKKYPSKLGVHIGYSDALAHQIEAGSDLFLMPSLFEPCGLNQIYSLKYGTIPIVRATGGLDDTIENFDLLDKRGNGFKFYNADNDALYHTVVWAVETYQKEPEAFRLMQKRAMSANFGWEEAARDYVDVYRYALAKRKVSKLQ